jgi:hypothetical protein
MANQLLIEGLELVETEGVEQKWIDIPEAQADLDKPPLGVLVNLIGVRRYKRLVARFERRKAKLGENAPQRLFDQLDAEMEEKLGDLMVADLRNATIANLELILRPEKQKFGGPKYAELREKGVVIPADTPVKVGNGTVRFATWVYANAWPAKFANVVFKALTEADQTATDEGDEGKDD